MIAAIKIAAHTLIRQTWGCATIYHHAEREMRPTSKCTHTREICGISEYFAKDAPIGSPMHMPNHECKCAQRTRVELHMRLRKLALQEHVHPVE